MGLVSTTHSRGNDLIDDDRARGSQPFGLWQWLAAMPPEVTSPRSMILDVRFLCVHLFGWGIFVNISHVDIYMMHKSISQPSALSVRFSLTLSEYLA